MSGQDYPVRVVSENDPVDGSRQIVIVCRDRGVLVLSPEQALDLSRALADEAIQSLETIK